MKFSTLILLLLLLLLMSMLLLLLLMLLLMLLILLLLLLLLILLVRMIMIEMLGGSVWACLTMNNIIGELPTVRQYYGTIYLPSSWFGFGRRRERRVVV